MRRHGDCKRMRFDSRCCPRVLSRRRRFYSKRLLLGAFASETARQLTSFSGLASKLTRSHDQPGCACVPKCTELRMRILCCDQAYRAAVNGIKFRVKLVRCILHHGASLSEEVDYVYSCGNSNLKNRLKLKLRRHFSIDVLQVGNSTHSYNDR